MATGNEGHKSTGTKIRATFLGMPGKTLTSGDHRTCTKTCVLLCLESGKTSIYNHGAVCKPATITSLRQSVITLLRKNNRRGGSAILRKIDEDGAAPGLYLGENRHAPRRRK